jgi:hypothetical protein
MHGARCPWGLVSPWWSLSLLGNDILKYHEPPRHRTLCADRATPADACLLAIPNLLRAGACLAHCHIRMHPHAIRRGRGSLELQGPCGPANGQPSHGSSRSNGPALIAAFDPSQSLSAHRHPPGASDHRHPSRVRRERRAHSGLASIASAPHQPFGSPPSLQAKRSPPQQAFVATRATVSASLGGSARRGDCTAARSAPPPLHQVHRRATFSPRPRSSVRCADSASSFERSNLPAIPWMARRLPF